MASTEAPKRYPTRKRAEVSYKTVDKYEELGDDVENEPNVKNDPDDEVDWRTSKMKTSKSKARKKQPSKAPKRDVFPFLKLPPELRNVIYKHCLQSPGGVNLALHAVEPHFTRRRLVQVYYPAWGYASYRSLDFGIGRNPSRNLALLRVSREVYREAVGFFYGQRFFFKNLSAMWNFLYFLSPETKALLRDLEVKPTEADWSHLPAVVAELPKKANNLERLMIHGLGAHPGVGNPKKYLSATGRNTETWDATVPNSDKIIGIILAKATYDFMFPFIVGFVKQHGVGRLVDILNPFVTKPSLDYRFYSLEWRLQGNINLSLKPWCEHRAARAREAMILELVDLIAKDGL